MQIEQNNYVNVFIDKEKHIKINLGGFLSFLWSVQLCEITIASSRLPLFFVSLEKRIKRIHVHGDLHSDYSNQVYCMIYEGKNILFPPI